MTVVWGSWRRESRERGWEKWTACSLMNTSDEAEGPAWCAIHSMTCLYSETAAMKGTFLHFVRAPFQTHKRSCKLALCDVTRSPFITPSTTNPDRHFVCFSTSKQTNLKLNLNCIVIYFGNLFSFNWLVAVVYSRVSVKIQNTWMYFSGVHTHY